ncbi:hypothetical protein Pan241w_21090 [Gimesia alba]|uniref:Uncharacterized protein n=1 Tax=Gimesia alba TaxID=2527973 RepID=A0A517RDS0_9PLAN|nr:hypothetical protein [Gimesia alba]QDT42028.1 hypothetical protein Pan241w_21090 [Gimesia alba]
MWNASSEPVSGQPVVRFTVKNDTELVTYADVLNLWQQDTEFSAWFVSVLADAPFSAFRWETPPVSTKTIDRPFEFVLIDSPGLAEYPDDKTFAAHFLDDTGTGVVVFPNLRKDAILVVPSPQDAAADYGHLAAFVREAPKLQKRELWKAVSTAMQQRLSSKPVWLSTAGAGVSWLHVRLDDRPKYYHYQPYRAME